MQPRADFLGGEDRTGRAPLRRVHVSAMNVFSGSTGRDAGGRGW